MSPGQGGKGTGKAGRGGSSHLGANLGQRFHCLQNAACPPPALSARAPHAVSFFFPGEEAFSSLRSSVCPYGKFLGEVSLGCRVFPLEGGCSGAMAVTAVPSPSTHGVRQHAGRCRGRRLRGSPLLWLCTRRGPLHAPAHPLAGPGHPSEVEPPSLPGAGEGAVLPLHHGGAGPAEHAQR